MLENPLVSIVIPVYNSESTLEETLTSALDQTYSNIEVLVVDDGSTDDTMKICKKFENKIKYYHKQNGGIASALNSGIKNMSGQWFKWLSSDDILVKDAVKQLLNMAEKEKGMIVYSDYIKIDKDGKNIGLHQEPVLNDYFSFASKLWIQYIGNASSILIHRSCFEKVGLFDESLRFCEDYDWWLRAALIHKYNFLHLRELILKYRIHPKQLTAKTELKHFNTNQMIRRKVKDIIIKQDFLWWQELEEKRKIYNKLPFIQQMKRNYHLFTKYRVLSI